VAQQDFQLLRHESVLALLKLSKVDHRAASAVPVHDKIEMDTT
jgi:hypothetical protein